ncbi:PH domain-containing protein [Corynebacterium sp. NPDC060344]|uniref:PH domain-containing protein n=1 Tax=Corynebacterium sp. NPDC060344 TaxID=3347101 RepID=UPI00365B007A
MTAPSHPNPSHHGPGGPDDRGPVGRGGHDAGGSGIPSRPGPIGPGRRRVHPVTPLLAGGRALAAVIAIIAFNVVQQSTSLGKIIELLTDSGPIVWLVSTGVALLAVAVTAALSWVSWRYRFFELADDEVRIGSGWLIRSRRTARFDRVQAVDVNQPLLARLAGLGEVKVETAGGDDSDLTIRFLTMDDCRAVRAAVLEAKRETEGHGYGPPPGHDPRQLPGQSGDQGPDQNADHATAIHGPVPPGRLFASAALGPGLLVLLFIPIAFFASFAALTALGAVEGVSVTEAIVMTFGAIAGTSFIGVAVFLFGIVASVWQKWNKFHGFTLSADDRAGRLHISAGLTATRRQTIPVRRIHAVQIVEPAWWRPMHWSTVRINVAGYAGEGSEISTVLLPVAHVPDSDAVVDGLIGRMTDLRRQPSEAMWSSPQRAVWLSPIDWRNQTVRVTPRALVITSGRLRRYRTIIPWTRIQGHTLQQGPLSRALSLYTVRIDLVGGPITVAAAQLAPDDAARLMRVLDERRGA